MIEDVAKAKAQEAHDALSEAYARVNAAWVNEPRTQQSKELMVIMGKVARARQLLDEFLA